MKHLKKLAYIKNDNNLCNFIANLKANFINILIVRPNYAFIHLFTLNLVKIYRNIIDAITIISFSN